MAQIEIFKNECFGEVRVAGTSDEPLFCLADVCKVLELGNPSQVKTRLDDGVITNEVIMDYVGCKVFNALPFANMEKLRIFAALYKLKGGEVRNSMWAIFMPINRHIRFHAPVSQVNAATAFEVYSNGSAWNRFPFPAKQTF